MECASVRFASRCGGETPIRSHPCAEFNTCCAMMRSSRSSAAVAARELHARARHARARQLACAWSARAR
eukprot:11185898-Lingulodinium_polyedra.AAC.1